MKKLFKEYFKIEYILLFLISFEVFNLHHDWLLALGLFLLLKSFSKFAYGIKKYSFWLLLSWGLLYFLFLKEIAWSRIQIFSILSAFLIGYYLVKDEYSFFKLFFVFAIGYALEGVLTAYFSGGFIIAENGSDRVLQSIWGNNRSVSAQNVTMYLFSGVFVYLLQKKEISLFWKIVIIFFEVFFVVFNVMRTAMRSSLIMPPIIIVVSYLVYIKKNKRAKSLIWVAAAILIIIVLFNDNFLGLKTIFEDSYVYSRFDNQDDGGIIHNARFELQRSFFKTWYLYPFGGMHKALGYYFHNTWLDMYAFGGIFSAILFFIITIRLLRMFFFVVRRVSSQEQSLITGILLAFLLPFYMDPMFWAAPCYFAAFIMYFGALNKRKDILINHASNNSNSTNLVK